MDTRFVLNASSTYSGDTLFTIPNTTAGRNNRLRIEAGTDNVLPTTTVLTLDGGNGAGTGRRMWFNLNGNEQTLAGLTNVPRNLRDQQVRGDGTLTIDNIDDFSYSAKLTGTGLNLVKSGPGTQTLSGSNDFGGTTMINDGTLRGDVAGNCANTSVSLESASATLGVLISDNTQSWSCDALTANAAGTIEFEFGALVPSDTVSPLVITGASGTADFTTATPAVSVVVSAGLLPGTYPLMTWDVLLGTAPTTAELTVSEEVSGTSSSLSVSGNTLSLVVISTASTVVKANNASDLNLGASWVGGVAPVPGDSGKWDNTVTSANTTVLGADLSWAGIAIEDPSGPVTIAAGNTLALGAAVFDIDLSTATADLTLDCDLVLDDKHVWNVADGRILTLNGSVSGGFSVAKQGNGTVDGLGYHRQHGGQHGLHLDGRG